MQNLLPDAPSVVLFMMDQLSAKWLEAAEGGLCPLPNFTRLRQSGTYFSNAITSNPVCCAARATLATGLTSRGHGVLENGYALDPALPTFMRTLQQAGWHTGAFGKVHLRPHFAGLFPDYRPYGFDVTHITEDARGGEWLDWVEACHPEHYEAVLATVWASYLPGFAEYGPDKKNLRERIDAARAAHVWPTEDFPLNTPDAYALPLPAAVSQTEWVTGHASDFLRQTPSTQPLLAHISYVQPHSPFCAPGDDIRQVNPALLPEPVPAEWLRDPHVPAYFRGKSPDLREDWRFQRQVYFANLVHLDRQLGEVYRALEHTGRLPNTYIILLSDHGELLGDHGFYGKEERHYDACLRVPLTIAGPNVRAGQTQAEMVQLEDICPTVLDIAGQSFPPTPTAGRYLDPHGEAAYALPGRSLLPLCRGESVTDWRDAAYSESYNALWSSSPGDWARTLRTTEYRYTFYANGNGEQLFHLKSDPDEQHNLAADPAHAVLRQSLRDALLERIVLQDYPKTRRSLFALGVH